MGVSLRILLTQLLLCAMMPIKSFVLASGYHARVCGGSIRHVHLSVGKDPSTQMTVSFSSIRSNHNPLIGGVMFGTEPDKLDIYVEEQEPARYYNATPVKESQGHYYSPFQHHVQIEGLDPSTRYYFKCVVNTPNHRPLHGTDDDDNHDDDDDGVNSSLRGRYNNHGPSFSEEVTRAEERDKFIDDDGVMISDEEGDEDSGRRSRQRRFLSLVYYDSTRGACPPPSKIRSFRTAPPVGTVGDPPTSTTRKPSLKFAYIGDIGQFTHSIETIKHLVTHQQSSISAIILAGDIAYTGYDNRRWDTYFDFMDDFFCIDEIPLQVCAGNHDIEKQEKDNDIFLAYEHRFRMPQVKPAELGKYQGPLGYLNMDTPDYPLPYEYGNSYYAFSYGISHNIFLNAYAAMEPNSAQYQWFLQELQSVDRDVTPWLIVTIHVPVYNTFDVHHHDLQIVAAKEHLEPLFVEYQVNLVITGHIHAYQRTKNVAFNKVDPKGPVHIVVGAGGRQCEASFQSEEPEPWVAVRDATRYGYGTLEMFNKTHAKWHWIITGESEYQELNTVWKQNKTLPPLQHSDTVVLTNQYFIPI